LKDLRRALDENSARLAGDPKAANVLLAVRNDPRFNALHGQPEYEQLVGGNH
jgi:hypothetical protein